MCDGGTAIRAQLRPNIIDLNQTKFRCRAMSSLNADNLARELIIRIIKACKSLAGPLGDHLHIRYIQEKTQGWLIADGHWIAVTIGNPPIPQVVHRPSLS